MRAEAFETSLAETGSVAQENINVVLNRLPLRMPLALAALAFASLSGVAAEAQQQPIRVTINGNAAALSPDPIMQGDRVFVPLRGLFERLGASVDYSAGHIDANGNGHAVGLSINSNQVTVNGTRESIDVAPFIARGSTFVPLRFVSQALGADVAWDAARQVVAVATSDATAYGGSQNAPPQQDSAVPAPDQTIGEDGALPSYAQDTSAPYLSYATQAPPPLPEYDLPPVPEPNYIWQPGFWALGNAGYFWVPGTWVPAPQPGYLWTPAYWGFNNGGFGFHPGYWATVVGFYGGIDYGGGYFGHGYSGGRWHGDRFDYNTAVTRVVNTTIINNIYVDNTIVDAHPGRTRYSYAGGPHGVAATPTASERVAASAPHLPMTPVQRRHLLTAAGDRQMLAHVNGGQPAIVAAPRAFSASRKPAGAAPITAQDRLAAQPVISALPQLDHRHVRSTHR